MTTGNTYKGSESTQVEAVSVLPEGQNDFELIERCLAGEVSAFDTLVQKYQRDVYRLAYHMTLSADDAKDLAQETFLQAYRAPQEVVHANAYLGRTSGMVNTSGRDRSPRVRARCSTGCTSRTVRPSRAVVSASAGSLLSS